MKSSLEEGASVLPHECGGMLEDFNLLATTMRRTEREARSELRYLLEEIGDSEAVVDRTGISGLIVAKSILDSFDVILKLRAVLLERPYEFRYILRVIPVEKIVHTDLAEISQAAEESASRIGEDESFRVTVEKRFTTIHSHDIVETVAAKIHRKVDLENPDKVLLVEVVGQLTGVSLVKPNDVLSVLKEKLL